MTRAGLLMCVFLMLAPIVTACHLVAPTPDPEMIQRLVAEAVRATMEAMPTATPYPTYTPAPLPSSSTSHPTSTAVSGASISPKPIQATPTSQAGTSTAFRTHTVVAGDTLSALAKHYGTTVEAIVEANGIKDPSLIVVGQVLNIPVGKTGPATPTPTGAPETPTPTPTRTPSP